MSHLEVVKWILRYLKSSVGRGLHIKRGKQPFHLIAYFDIDWTGYPDSRCSTTGYCIFLGSNFILWCAKKQPTISHSSAKTEY